MWDFSIIFHEKQEGRLCAQHCLNAVLQGPYFTAVDLSEIALGLDEEERQQMSENENGVESEDYKRFLQQPSGNMDDTGFFSVQVISKALALWGLDLIPLHSSDAIATDIRSHPIKAHAYIFNMESHWYCIRRFKTDSQAPPLPPPPSSRPNDAAPHAFFNLDSLLSRPEYMSSSFLTEYLKQMQNEGYSIFVVSGEFPECAAEPLTYLKNRPAASLPAASVTQIIDLSKSESKSSVSEQDEDIQRAIRLSLDEYAKKYDRYSIECGANIDPAIDDNSIEHNTDLEAALKLSLDGFGDTNQARSGPEPLTPTQLRDKRLAYFSAMSSNEK